MPVIEHHDKGAEINLLLLSIETERQADFRSYGIINYCLAGVEALGNKEGPRTFHLTVESKILRVRSSDGPLHDGFRKRHQELGAMSQGAITL